MIFLAHYNPFVLELALCGGVERLYDTFTHVAYLGREHLSLVFLGIGLNKHTCPVLIACL